MPQDNQEEKHIMLKDRKAYKKQLKNHKKLEVKIKNAKKRAKENVNGEAHKYVKHAVDELIELYSSQEFCKNENFLLYRYAKLESKGQIWYTLFIPALLALFITKDNIKIIPEALADLWKVFTEFSEIKDEMLPIQLVTSIILLCVALGAIATLAFLIYRLCVLMIHSVTRDANTTIIENEMCIIRSLLKQHGEFLDDEKVKKMAEKWCAKK